MFLELILDPLGCPTLSMKSKTKRNLGTITDAGKDETFTDLTVKGGTDIRANEFHKTLSHKDFLKIKTITLENNTSINTCIYAIEQSITKHGKNIHTYRILASKRR